MKKVNARTALVKNQDGHSQQALLPAADLNKGPRESMRGLPKIVQPVLSVGNALTYESIISQYQSQGVSQMKQLIAASAGPNVPDVLREKFPVVDDKVRLDQLIHWRQKQTDKESEFVIVKTCNRVEYYYYGKNPQRSILEALQEIPTEILSLMEFKTDELAFAHLLEVASGLRSKVFGETNVLGQVKESYTLALKNGTTGRVANTIFQEAIRIASKVHNNTCISKGRISTESIAIDFMRQVFDQGKNVLVMGTGPTAKRLVEHLQDEKPSRLVIASSTQSRANDFINQCQLQNTDVLAVAYDSKAFEDAVIQSDAIFGASDRHRVQLRSSLLMQNLETRKFATLLLVDTSQPSIIDRITHESIYQYSIDDIGSSQSAVFDERRQGLPAAMDIINSNTESVWKSLKRSGFQQNLTRWTAQHVKRSLETHSSNPERACQNLAAAMSHGLREYVKNADEQSLTMLSKCLNLEEF